MMYSDTVRSEFAHLRNVSSSDRMAKRYLHSLALSTRYLMLIDVPKERVDGIEAMVREHHPEAEFERVGARALNAPLP